MPNLVATIGADTSRFTQEIASAQHMLNKFEKDTKTASDSVRKNASVTSEQVTAYRNVVNALSKVASGTLNTKKQQAELTAQIKELKVQWANLSETAKSGEFGKMLSSTLGESQSQLSRLTDQIKQADSSMSSFGQGNAKRQLMGLSKELTNLTVQYRQMTAAEKQSAAGQELAQKLSDLRTKAGELKDTVGDVQAEIKVLASDTPNLDVFNDAIGLGADALSAYSSILARVTGDEKALKDAIATVMAVQSAANFVTKLTNALQSSSAIMLKTRAIQEGAAALAIRIRTAAEGKSVITTKAATAAQAAFNAVAKMNPYVLLATAIIAAGAAIYGFTKYLDKQTAEQERANKKAEEFKKKQEEVRQKQEELSNSSAKVQSKFAQLQAQWQSLKSVAEKKKWIEDNKSAFSDLGLSITNVKTAEDIFVKNTDKVIEALIQRAVAAKQAEQAADDLTKLYDEKKEKSYRSGYKQKVVNAKTRVSDEDADAAGVRRNNQVFVGVNPNSKRTAEEVKKLNDYYAKQARERAKKFHSDIDKRIAERKDDYIKGIQSEADANKTLSGMGDKPVTTSSPKSKPDKPDKPDKIEVEPVLAEGSLAKLEKEISDKQKELKLAVSDESRAKIQAEIDEKTGQKEAIELKLKPVVSEKDIKKIQEEMAEHSSDVAENIKKQKNTTPEQGAQNNANNLKTELDFNKQIVKSLQDQYDAVQKRISIGATLTSNEQQLVNIYDQAKDRVDELGDAYEKAAKKAELLKTNSELKEKQWEGLKTGIGTLGNVNNAIRSTTSEWQYLMENWNDMSPFEQITSAFGTVISTIQNVVQAYEAINTMMELFGTISELTAAKKVAADNTEKTSEIGKLGVSQATSTAEVTKQGSKLPFPANIAAIAAGVAAVASAFAAVFSCFADGGIVGNGSKIGDYNIARVNGGEMILNGTQQKRLFNLLNGVGGYVNGPIQKQNVNFVIKGKTLRGVLRNFDNANNRI